MNIDIKDKVKEVLSLNVMFFSHDFIDKKTI